MDERKAFEAWYSQSISESPGMLMKHPNGEYVYLTNEWLAWQAATAAERERAAKVCDEFERRTLSLQDGPPEVLSNVMLRQVAVLGFAEAAAAIRKG